MKNKIFSIAGIVLGLSALLIHFQNCSDVSFSSAPSNNKPIDVCELYPSSCEGGRRPVLVSNSISVPPSTNAVDILFVIDNSGSMSQQLRELGNRFPNFIASLENLDWQVCVTTTDVSTGGTANNGREGRLMNLNVNANGNNQNPQELWINKNTQNAAQKFLNRMNNMRNGNGDERGIKAINLALQRNEGCFRPGAALATVVISDEDERSAGGYPQYEKADAYGPRNHGQLKELEPDDFPNSVFDTLAAKGFNNKVYTHHSIVIRPAVPSLGVPANDEQCLEEQAKENPAWYGTWYAELSRLTKGFLGNICAPNYGAQLAFIGQSISESLNTVPLECEPVTVLGTPETNANNIIKSIVPLPPPGTIRVVEGNKLRFSPGLPPGTNLTLNYYCLRQIDDQK